MLPSKLFRPRIAASFHSKIARCYHQRYSYHIQTTSKKPTLVTNSRIGQKRCLSSSSQGAVLNSSSAEQNDLNESADYFDVPSQIIDVSDLEEIMRRNVRKYTQKCNAEGNPVRLAGILAVDAMEDCHSAGVYASHIAKKLEEDGIQYEHVECHGEELQDIEAAIEELNLRPDIHGILVYYPIFKEKLREHANTSNSRKAHRYMNAANGVYYKSYDDYLRDAVCPEKDVEGLSHNYNSRWLFRARSQSHFRKQGEIYVPCTALAVARILEHYHTATTSSSDNDVDDDKYDCESLLDCEDLPDRPWLGKTVTIINRSEILGRPLAAMLALKGANVYSIDEHSVLQFMNTGKMRRCTEPYVTLEWCLEQSSLVVTGVPHEDFRLPLESIVADNVTVVNVSEFENVKEEDVFKSQGIKFVPKIGKVTVAALEHNLISLHKQATKGQR